MWLRTFIDSLTAPMYYLTVINRPLRFSIRFFVVCFFFLSILATTFFALSEYPKLRETFFAELDKSVPAYPENLQFTWNRENFSVEPPQVFSFAYPEGALQSPPTDNLAVIDTTGNDVEVAKKKSETSAFIFVTQKTLFISDLNGSWFDVELRDVLFFDREFVVTRENLPEVVASVKSTIHSYAPIIFFGYFVSFFLLHTLAILIAVTIDSLLIFFLLRIFQHPLPFVKLLQISLHVAVAAELVSIVGQRFVATSELNVFSLTYWLYMAVILFYLRGVQQVFLVKKEVK